MTNKSTSTTSASANTDGGSYPLAEDAKLEQISDKLLRSAKVIGYDDFPARSERAIMRPTREAFKTIPAEYISASNINTTIKQSAPNSPSALIYESLRDELMQTARDHQCTERQMVILDMYIDENTLVEIATALRITRQTVASDLKLTLETICRYCQCVGTLLSETFEQEHLITRSDGFE